MRYWLLAISLLAATRAQPPVGSRSFKLEELKTPPGFEVSVFARVSGGPRLMTFGPNGVLYVAARAGRSVVAIPSPNQPIQVLRGLNGPHSLAFRNGDLYVSVDDGVLRFRNAVTSDLVIRSAGERLLTLPSGGGHSTRTLGFGPDGKLYATVGSTCNFCVESDPRRAAMMRYEADGSRESIHARGLRNSVGFAWHPVTAELWAVDNGGDGLGDNEPPEEINVIQEEADYGWPDCVGQSRGISWGGQARPERCAAMPGPELEMQAHSAPLGISFYTGEQFPASFRNDALVGFHGSWNRNEPTGYKVVRVRASSGRADGLEDFLWGFLDLQTRTYSGRPVHALNGPDGAVYVSDDATGNIYRVIYTGPRINPGGIVHVAGNIYEMYGANLAGASGQVEIRANGALAETLYSSPTQVNFVLPGAMTDQITVTVKNDKAADQTVIRAE